MGYIAWQQFSKIDAFTTTRDDGFSKAPFLSNNLAFHVGDDYEDVLKNRQKMMKEHDIQKDHFVIVYQSHSDVMEKVDASFGGAGADTFESGVKADALYTKDHSVALGIFHADCVPIFFYVPKHDIIGVIHAGAPGTLKSITEKVVKKLMDNEGVEPQDIYFHFGPSLCFAHRLIDLAKRNEIIRLGDDFIKGLKETDDKIFLDIPLINYIQLRKLGVPPQNISLSDACTFEENQTFFSAEKEKKTGRMMSVIKFR